MRGVAGPWHIWIDRGGTFTDCVGRDPNTGLLRAVKLLSSDAAPLLGIRRLLGLAEDSPLPPCRVRMGTTLATNGLLERRGAACGLAITRGFNLPVYAAAFGSEELGFKKAFQALLNFVDHESLDLGGRRIEVTAPIDMQAAVSNKTSFSTRRVIRNGQFNVVAGPAWAPTVVTSQAGYSTAMPTTLSGVVNVANIPVGALVQGT